MAIHGYYLGCPGWGVKTWVGRLFPTGTRPTEFLERYARVFNTVEGNTTFYALPAARDRRALARPGARRVPVLLQVPARGQPRQAAGRLRRRGRERFLDRVAPLGDKLGTLFLQLPPRFDAHAAAAPARVPRRPARRPRLRRRAAPRGVLPRRPRRDARARAAARARRRSRHHGHARPPRRPQPRARRRPRAQAEPAGARAQRPATRPIVRCVPHEQFDAARPFVEPWAAQIARWIGEGKRPYFFMHAPDDTFAPENAYAFHAMVRRQPTSASCRRGRAARASSPSCSQHQPRLQEHAARRPVATISSPAARRRACSRSA